MRDTGRHQALRKPAGLVARLVLQGPALLVSGVIWGLTTTTRPGHARSWNPLSGLFYYRFMESDILAGGFGFIAVGLALFAVQDQLRNAVAVESPLAGDVIAQYVVPGLARLCAWGTVVLATWQFSPEGGRSVQWIVVMCVMAVLAVEMAVVPPLLPTERIRQKQVERAARARCKHEAGSLLLDSYVVTPSPVRPVGLFLTWTVVAGTLATVLFLAPPAVAQGPSFFAGWESSLDYVAVLIAFHGAASAFELWALAAGVALRARLHRRSSRAVVSVGLHAVPVGIVALIAVLALMSPGDGAWALGNTLQAVVIFAGPYVAVMAGLRWRRGPAAWRWAHTARVWRHRATELDRELRRLNALQLAA